MKEPLVMTGQDGLPAAVQNEEGVFIAVREIGKGELLTVSGEGLMSMAMGIAGRNTSEKKLAALETARHHAATKRRAEGLSEEHKAKLKEAQQVRREREKREKENT